jgi:uncharacterized protein
MEGKRMSGHDGTDNHSDNDCFAAVLARRLGRRDILAGVAGAGLGAMAGLFAVPPLQARAAGTAPLRGAKRSAPQVELGFTPVAMSRLDSVVVPEGYSARPFLPWGTPITGSYPAFRPDGGNTAAEQAQQIGQHHDGMHYFPLRSGAAANTGGLLCVNHEYVQLNTLHPEGPTVVGGKRTVAAEALKEIAAHGVSVVEIRRDETAGTWRAVRGRYNRRITGATPMEFTGPARGSPLLQTRYSPRGTRVRGTLNNCAHGVTPWGTYLTCEENWAEYFSTQEPQPGRHLARYGIGQRSKRYRWEDLPGADFERFDLTPRPGAVARQDDRNEANGFGWVVEIDPFAPRSTPKKRTALGRFAHEGAWFAPPVAGRPLVIYMGDDSRNEYIYKFVTREPWDPARTNGNCLDDGVLHVARFDDDGSGRWLALDLSDAGFRAAAAARGVSFESQADVLVNTRLAADVAGATRMDRPEWAAVHPVTGEVYFTLTNNLSRSPSATDAANPRGQNPYGHIIRWHEAERRADSLRFAWNIFLLAGPPTDSALPRADGSRGPADPASDMFASPDGLWFDPFGTLWIQTDMSESQLNEGPFGNNQMLAANPASGVVKRFFTGVPGCEVSGVVSTPDGRTLFVNVQHPGEQGEIPAGARWSSSWPDGGDARPRSATVIVTRDDGGIVGS